MGHHPARLMKHNHPSLPFIAMLILCIFPAGCFFSDGIEDIGLKTLKSLMEKEKRLVVVDNRSALEYASGHIPGAIHIPQEEFSRIASHLPAEKDTPIVFYCRGYG